MANILVTGGSGFIGSHLVDRLAESGHKVISFDLFPPRFGAPKPGVRFVQGDLSKPAPILYILQTEQVEVVYHAAWASIHETSLNDPAADIQANLVPTVHLLDACRQAGVRRLVYLSSGGTVYGIPDQLPVVESHPTRPINPYGVAKLAAEKYTHMFGHLYGLETVILRPSVPYGPRQNPYRRQGAVTVFTYRALKGEPIEIWGDGGVIRDYFYVGDLCSALAACLEADAAGHVINLGGGQGLSLNDLVARIGTILSRPLNVSYRPVRAFDVPRLVLDIRLAENVLGWRPLTDLEAGIRSTAAWLKANESEM